MSTVAFIGLGLMGEPMARNLLKGGHIVRAFDVRTDAMTALANEGAVSADSPADAAAGVEYIFTMLPSGKEVNQAVFGENGFAQSMNENALFIDTSTILPADTDEISAKLAAKGLKMMDAPVGRLAENAIEYKTTTRLPAETIEFTPEQVEFILDQAKDGLSSLHIARIVFPDRQVRPLSAEQRAVLATIREVNPDIMPSQDSGALNSYIPPKATSRIIKKINDATGIGLEESKLNRQKQICVAKLMVNLSNSRFLKIINKFLWVIIKNAMRNNCISSNSFLTIKGGQVP